MYVTKKCKIYEIDIAILKCIVLLLFTSNNFIDKYQHYV